MAAILHRKPLTIKQQVEELKNWHKQQQYKLDPKILDRENSTNKFNDDKNSNFRNSPSDSNSTTRINFDEVPIKVSNSNFNTIVENNIAPVDSHPEFQTGRPQEKGNTPKFRFLKKGEGIARFNMRPPKVGKKTIPRKQSLGLKLIKEPTKSDAPLRKQETVNQPNSVDPGKMGGIPTLQVPDLKLNFTWKSILSGENPEEMLEKAISTNQLELMDPNTSIDSSTASLMEKLLAIGKNKLSRDREELKVFEAIEKHMLDSSFSSTSSYVTKLMENAVMSTPNKDTIYHHQRQTLANTSKHSDQLPSKTVQDGDDLSSLQGVSSKTISNPSSNFTLGENYEKVTKSSAADNKLLSSQNQSKNNTGQTNIQPVATWTNLDPVRNQDFDITAEESIQDLEQSLHVRFAEQVDYKSFVEHTQSIDSISQREENGSLEFDESQEWKEDSEDSSSSCCSQCSQLDSSTDNVTPFNPQEKQLLQSNQCHSQSEQIIPIENQHAGDLKNYNLPDNNEPSTNEGLNNFPPLLLAKLRELEEEIKTFREENSSIKSLRESLEKERRKIQEEKRGLHLEKKKLQKEVEEEKKRLTTQIEEEKQKLAKEKTIFEKYSKSLTKNPSREERREIQALREQLTEMKEELNKKESRWGAAQARVRNQVKVLEEDNKKLREEIETFKKQAKYFELFNNNKKGKPFNNTKLIHAISEHISNLVLNDENSHEQTSGNNSYFNKDSYAPKTSSITQSDLKNMYGVKVIKEKKTDSSTLPSSKNTSKSISISKDFSHRKDASDVEADNGGNAVNKSPCESYTPRIVAKFPVSPSSTSDQRNVKTEDRCQKPCLEEDSSNVIKEVIDENGNVEIVFPNGNIKKINKITGSEKYIYINGDVEEVTHDGTVKYYYSKSRIWQTTLPDGLEIVDFPDGKVEKRHIDGTMEIIYSNNNKKFNYPDGSQEIIYTDGTRLKTEADKSQILTLPNGQKEIHTEEWKRREYPDGTMKTLYPDGTTETVYSNGRVRLKDKYGNLVMDSGSPQRF